MWSPGRRRTTAQWRRDSHEAQVYRRAVLGEGRYLRVGQPLVLGLDRGPHEQGLRHLLDRRAERAGPPMGVRTTRWAHPDRTRPGPPLPTPRLCEPRSS